MKPGLETLRSLPLFADLSAKDLADLDRSADLTGFGPDEKLFEAGDQLSELSYLLTGYIGAKDPRSTNGDTLVDILLPVRPLCLPAVLLGFPAPVGAYALTAGRLITFPADRLREMIHRRSGLARAFLDGALGEAHEQAEEIRSLKLQSSPQRLAAYLLQLITDPDESPARIVLPFERRLLAAKVGCAEENVTRAFAALRRLGVVTEREVVVARDVPALKAFASTSGWRRTIPRRQVGRGGGGPKPRPPVGTSGTPLTGEAKADQADAEQCQ